MPAFSATLTEANPAYTEGHGGGRRPFDLEEALSEYVAAGGGRRSITLTERSPEHPWTPTSVGGFNPALGELML
ncbi:MAG: hypothetical protein ACE5IA_04635 [Dehalococcoidia bacterium]